MTTSPAIRADDIRRIHYGYFVSPPDQPDAGQPVPVTGFLIQHPQGTLLFDTGLAPLDDATRERYQPRLSDPLDALRSAGVEPGSITHIANCHLHADHAGGNSRFPGIPIYVQEAERRAAREPDYTDPRYAFDFPGARLEVVDGDTEIAPGLRLVPTPGHSPGHQSLLVATDCGVIMLAGQASNTAWMFSTAAFAERVAASLGDKVGTHPDWTAGLREWRVARALFAHDLLVWEPDPASLGQPAPG